jgi:hypothetical protein
MDAVITRWTPPACGVIIRSGRSLNWYRKCRSRLTAIVRFPYPQSEVESRRGASVPNYPAFATTIVRRTAALRAKQAID